MNEVEKRKALIGEIVNLLPNGKKVCLVDSVEVLSPTIPSNRGKAYKMARVDGTLYCWINSYWFDGKIEVNEWSFTTESLEKLRDELCKTHRLMITANAHTGNDLTCILLFECEMPPAVSYAGFKEKIQSVMNVGWEYDDMWARIYFPDPDNTDCYILASLV